MQIILHIGIQKTASSAIQKYLAENRGHLAEQGILYPSTFGMRKTNNLKHYAIDGPRLPDRREALVSKLRAEFAGAYTKAVLSDEMIYPDQKGIYKRNLKKHFDEFGSSWRIICYVRRPDEHIVSQFQQKVRNSAGDPTRLDFATFDDFYKDRLTGHYYRYAMHMEEWEKVFGKGTVEVRLFHREALQGSPVSDFVQWIGADPAGLTPEDPRRVNESLDRISTEILLFLAYHCQRNPGRISQNDVRRALNILRPTTSEDRMRLDYRYAKQLHERFYKDHERLAARYLPAEHAALLLAPPVERPPQPPLEAAAVHERMMELFGDPELAQTAAAEITDPSGQPPRVRRERPRRSLWARLRSIIPDRLP